MEEDEVGKYFDCSMNKYVSSIVEDFEKHVGKTLKNKTTPAAPGSNILKNAEEIMDQSGYRKFVGKLLFAVKKILPDSTNAIRELSMHLENPGKEAWKALGRLVSYHKYHYTKLKLRKPNKMKAGAKVDSDWAADRNDRKSTTSFLTIIGDACLTNWSSKKQKTVSLSSTEAELYAECNAAQDIMFMNNLLGEILGHEPEKPSNLEGDNMGAIFAAQNLSVSQRMKHIDIKTRFITDLVEDKELVVTHIRSEDNPADLGSKNCKEAIHNKHSRDIYDGYFELGVGEGDASSVTPASKRS